MSEKESAEAQLRDAAERFREAAAVSPSHWGAVPSGGSHWSISHVTEHVAISCRDIAARLESRLGASPIRRGATGVRDAEMPYLFYRGEEPPSVAAPTGTWSDREDALRELDASVAAILAWSKTNRLEFRDFGIAHPVFGVLDGLQWLLFAAAHTERHRAQVIGIRGRLDSSA